MKLKTTVDRFLAQDEHMLSFGDSPQGSVAIREEGQTMRREEIAAYTGVARLMPEFEKVLRQDLWLTQNPKKRIATKKKLIRRYVADSDKLLQLAKELNDFVHDCIFSGIIFWNPEIAYGVDEHLRDATERLASDVIMPMIPLGVDTTADIVAKYDVNELQQRLRASLETSCSRLTENFFAMLERGVEQFVFGRVMTPTDFHPNDACPAARYWYFTRLIENSKKPPGNGYSARAVTLHVHDVVDVQFVSLPARRVGKPAWMRPLIATVPKLLRKVPGGVTVLAGDLTLERVFVQGCNPTPEERRRPLPRQWKDWRPSVGDLLDCLDPALVVAHTFVLTGWNPAEPEPQSKDPEASDE